MVLINLAALLIFILLFSYIAKEEVVDVMPAAISLLILLLYLLAFAGHLSAIDGISILFLLGMAVYLVMLKKEGRARLQKEITSRLKHPGIYIILAVMIVVTVLTKDKVVTWWDDYNFWATDAKALFYLDGFAGKYQNAAPEFGDYPPGIQLMKWYFLHFSTDVFKESLLFGGYYCMNLIFLAPLLRAFGKRGANKSIAVKIVIGVLSGITLWLLPGVAESFYFDGASADLTMALVYGAFLAAVLGDKGHKAWFYYGRMGLYLSVLVLIKNVGFMWAGFGIIFAMCYTLIQKKQKRGLLFVILAPIFAEGSWLLFCYQMRRVAKLTGSAVSMVTSGVSLPDITGELVRSFFTSFLTGPLHRWKTWFVDFTPIGLFAVIILAVILFYRMQIIPKKTATFLVIYFTVNAIVFYSINLISHLTIFALETQYLEPYNMVSSISRYGAPFTVGSLYLLVFLLLEHNLRPPKRWEGHKWGNLWNQYGAWCICILFVFLTTDHNSSYRALVGYRQTVTKEMETRKEVIGDTGNRFVDKFYEEWDMEQGRILYLQDGTDVRWVGNTYLNYELSPISLMHGSINTELLSKEEQEAEFKRLINESHAQYLYVNPIGGDIDIIFSNYAQDKFQFETFYHITEKDGKLWLEELLKKE